MSDTSRWEMRVTNNTLFIDDLALGRVVLQHNAHPGLRPYIHPLRIGKDRLCLTEDSPGTTLATWHPDRLSLCQRL